MKKQQSGFTMIELIMVIVILGILAAFALPRFADFSTDARVSTINGVAGGMRSASSIAHATLLAKGKPSDTSILLEGVTIDMSNGYPAASTTGIARAAQLDGVEIDDKTTGVLYVAPAGGTAASTSDCVVIYTQAVAASGTGTTAVDAQPAKVEVKDICTAN